MHFKTSCPAIIISQQCIHIISLFEINCLFPHTHKKIRPKLLVRGNCSWDIIKELSRKKRVPGEWKPKKTKYINNGNLKRIFQYPLQGILVKITSGNCKFIVMATHMMIITTMMIVSARIGCIT